MSYCRFGPDSDVYLYAHGAGGWECCACCMKDGASVRMYRKQAVLNHLLEHQRAGHNVPEYAIERITDEMKR